MKRSAMGSMRIAWRRWLHAAVLLHLCRCGLCCFGDFPSLDNRASEPSAGGRHRSSFDSSSYEYDSVDDRSSPDGGGAAFDDGGASAQPDIGLQITGLKAALGGDVNASPLTNTLTGDAILSAGELDCRLSSGRSCRWGNTNGDSLQWSRGTGRADLNRWLFIANTRVLPNPDFFMLASNPRRSSDAGYLVSDPIVCQDGDGTVSFRHWRSRARQQGNEPSVELCIRPRNSDRVQKCQPALDANPGPSEFTVPQSREPFELVIKGTNFVNEPEGGFVVVDDIKYTASVAQNCLLNFRPQDDDSVHTGAPPPDGGASSADTFDNFIRSEQPRFPPPDPDILPQDRIPLPALVPAPSQEQEKGRAQSPPQSPEIVDQDGCFAATCDFTLATGFCQLEPLGEGAKGEGRFTGWQLVTGRTNRANPLTGIRYDHERSKDGGFAVASFPDPRRTDVDPALRYVLETPTVAYSRTYYMNFKRWIAIDGAVLKLCRDGSALDCLWESESLIRGPTDASANRRWIDEVVAVPQGTYKLYLIAQYDIQRKYNVGQVGVSYLHFYKDLNLRNRLC